METGDHGEVTVRVITSAEVVYKNASDIVIIPPPPMAVVDVLDTVKWSRRATLKPVQVGPVGVHGVPVLYHVEVVSDSASVTVRKDTVRVHNHPLVYVA